MSERPHKKLEAWKKSMDLVSVVYELTRAFPANEEFGLKTQLRRAAISVPSNIAEGMTRRTQNDKSHFLNIAQSSISEIDTQADIALRLGYLGEESRKELDRYLVQVGRLLTGLAQSLR